MSPASRPLRTRIGEAIEQSLFRRTDPVPPPRSSGAVTLRADGIAVTRGGRLVLEDVSVDVRIGEVLVLVGPNGAGKSTLLAALSGDQDVHSGTVHLDDRNLGDWTALEMAQRRAVLPQQNTVGFSFTARQVITMGRSPWARTPRSDDDAAAIAEAMRICDVVAFADRPFTALSGGERARVALARVLTQRTETILLDEPTAALDLGHQETVMRLARSRAEQGTAVVVVLHDLALAAAYADRIVVLEQGRVAADGPPGDVLSEELLTRVYGHPVEVIEHPVTGATLVLPRRDQR
ncbi:MULTISPECIES: heme ABC transporter ATP-binding protein [Rhodococcus]|uniref:Hemin importer ATP-binding subunit n=1 Tax=Rhodococcus opacus RKJ300 = JCM 13270 TaxID=1165867 RepID=I0WMQ2_RHOOP|nr:MULTISPECIES: heme ABC transporter ATP-binding protein [Rhodococcus]EID77668.1 hemin importer ATP-binding subunit [Rhodococcus opacus RKJ300 = JCM 13270]QQZ16461.1 heme ABC transporter ATP-binding protein [Rhodococcus sp. 21391]